VLGARTKSLLKLALLIVILGAAYVFFWHTEAGQSINRESIHSFIASVDPALARLLYVLLYIVGTVLLFPGVLLSVLGALLFGVWEGTLYTCIGATIGATLAFLVARTLGREFVDRLLGGKLKALDQRLRERGFVSLLILRLMPQIPFNIINFVCGLTSIRLRDYVLATAIGIVPGTFVYQYLFATLGEKVLTEGFELSDLATLEVLLPMGLFLMFTVAAGWLARRLRSIGMAKHSDDISR